MYHLFKEFIPLLKALRKSGEFEIVDSHVHPFEVMNVVSSMDYETEKDLTSLKNTPNSYQQIYEDFTKADFAEKLKHNNIEKRLTKMAFRHLPQTVYSSIRKSYSYIGRKRLLDEMDAASIDKSVLLAVAPFNTIEDIHQVYGSDDHLFYLGSVDVHRIPVDQIESIIREQVSKYKIKGIKLHPNLQAVFPNPQDNSEEVAARLDRIYKTAEELGIYILLHGGTSNIVNRKYQISGFEYITQHSGGQYGLLENYTNNRGNSELFDTYQCHFVLAHMGFYGIINPDYKSLFKMAANYPHVYFDTSSLSSKVIARVIQNIGPDRIIFGSDALYNRQYIELFLVLEAMKKSCRKEQMDEYCYKILGQNLTRKVIQSGTRVLG